MNKHGFALILNTEVGELNSRARVWLHEKSGAQLLSFCNKDENKVFGVSLRTPPADSTGLPHILEHSVLCGSDKYPVKEPFVELLKGSLQTFLNAFTYPDKTCYPVASANLQDFYNLVDVYLDAVFHPRISEETLQQEGWHLDAAPTSDADPEDGQDSAPDSVTDSGGKEQIKFKGVVYNEMKGVFSSPEAVLERESFHILFPDTPYGLESGGDPAVIPQLTFEEFMAFHRRYYHPSNARFFFWGDDPEDRRLEILDEVLRPYERIDTAHSRIPLQRPFAKPASLRLPYAAGQDDKAMFTLSWVLPPVGSAPEELELTLALAMLNHILLGMPASPLRRALIESGLGEDLAGGGMQDELRQMLFSIGLKGIAEESAPAVEKLILDTLADLTEKGVPKASVEAAVNSIEFDLRENNTGRFPVGLAVMLRALATWLHSDDPAEGAGIAPLRFEGPLKAIKEKALRPEGGYFEGIIRAHFLENAHRASILLYPDQGYGEVLEREEEERVKAKLAALSPEEKAALPERSERLRALQEAPDAPEGLARIPRLALSDLPRENREIPQKKLTDLPLPVYFHPQPTNGICYLSAHLDISAVPDRLLPLLPLLGRAMLEMGNARRDFVELNMEIACKTGGMDSDVSLLTRLPDGSPIGSLAVSGKAAPDKVEDLFRLTAELLAETSLDDPERFGRMLLEEKARLEHSLVPSGHMVVSGRLKASLSLTGWLGDQCGGLGYLDAVRALCVEAGENWGAVLKKLEELRRIVLNRNGVILSVTAEAGFEPSLPGLVASLAGALPEGRLSPVSRAVQDLPRAEALLTPSQVNYMGLGMNLFELGYSYHGSAMAILKYLRTGYLWEKIRVQGGAYGAMIGLDRFSGDLVFLSYRDPNVQKTLKNFEGVAAFLRERAPEKRELESSIIGAIGDLDTYMLPEAKGASAFARALTGNTPELRAKVREEILSCGPDDFRRFGEALAEGLPRALRAGLGGAALAEYAGEAGWATRKLL